MAEVGADTEAEESSEVGVECAVCLQTSIYPVQLPCNHVFCFLCVKGFTTQSKRCAMCRREVPEDFIQNPELLPKVNLHAVTERAFEVIQSRQMSPSPNRLFISRMRAGVGSGSTRAGTAGGCMTSGPARRLRSLSRKVIRGVNCSLQAFSIS